MEPTDERKEEFKREALLKARQGLLEGKSDTLLKREIQDNANVTHRTATAWLKLVKKDIRKIAANLEEDMEQNMAMAYERFVMIYNLALKNNKFAQAIQAMDRICHLQGIDPKQAPQNLTISGGTVNIGNSQYNGPAIEHVPEQELMEVADTGAITVEEADYYIAQNEE